MSFRPTLAQAIGRGGVQGGAVGAAGGVVLFVLLATEVVELAGWAALAPPLLGGLVGAVRELAFGRDQGADIDDWGIHPVPAPPAVPHRQDLDVPGGRDAPWHRVADLRPERRGGRTQVAVYLDSGEIALLAAPYDGRLLAHDPAFERKLVMLRHLWETHRRGAAPAR